MNLGDRRVHGAKGTQVIITGVVKCRGYQHDTAFPLFTLPTTLIAATLIVDL